MYKLTINLNVTGVNPVRDRNDLAGPILELFTGRLQLPEFLSFFLYYLI